METENNITSSLTPNTGILALNGAVRRIGNIVYVSIQVTPNRNIAAFGDLIGNFPTALDGFDIVASSNTNLIPFYIKANGVMSNRMQLSNGVTYLITGSYITHDS